MQPGTSCSRASPDRQRHNPSGRQHPWRAAHRVLALLIVLAAIPAPALAVAAASVDFDVHGADTLTTAAVTYELRKAVLHEADVVIRPRAAQFTIHVRHHRTGGTRNDGTPIVGFIGWVSAHLPGVEGRRIRTVAVFDGSATQVEGFLASTAAAVAAASWLAPGKELHLAVGPRGTVDAIRPHLTARGLRHPGHDPGHPPAE